MDCISHSLMDEMMVSCLADFRNGVVLQGPKQECCGLRQLLSMIDGKNDLDGNEGENEIQ